MIERTAHTVAGNAELQRVRHDPALAREIVEVGQRLQDASVSRPRADDGVVDSQELDPRRPPAC